MQKSDVIRRSKKDRTQVTSQALFFSSVPVRISTTKALLGVLAWLRPNTCYGVSTEVKALQYKSWLLRPGFWTWCKYSPKLV